MSTVTICDIDDCNNFCGDSTMYDKSDLSLAGISSFFSMGSCIYDFCEEHLVDYLIESYDSFLENEKKEVISFARKNGFYDKLINVIEAEFKVVEG